MAEQKKHDFSLHKKEQTTVIDEVDYKKKQITVIEEDKKKQTTVIEEKHHKHLEIHGRLGAAAAAGAYALPEKHQAKKNPENAHKHKIAK